MSLKEELEKAFGKKKPKMVENAIDRAISNAVDEVPPKFEYIITPEKLHPPKIRVLDPALIPLKKDAQDAMIQATYNLQPGGIDFGYLANNSSFQRAIMEFIKKFVPGFENVKHRGSKEVMTQSFNQNAHNYKKVMIELKEKLAERRKKVDGS